MHSTPFDYYRVKMTLEMTTSLADTQRWTALTAQQQSTADEFALSFKTNVTDRKHAAMLFHSPNTQKIVNNRLKPTAKN